MKWKSIFSPDKLIHDAQYITEYICLNKARSEGVDLQTKFWEAPKWEKFYRSQIPAANSLLKQYSAIAIVKALKTIKGKRVFSLRAKFLIPLIEEQQKILNSKQQVKESDLNIAEGIVPQQNIKINIALEKLKELD
jgi:hypothetical protein